MNATAQVCEMKLSPVTAAAIDPTVTYTAQAAYDAYITFADLAGQTAFGKCNVIRQAAYAGMTMPDADALDKVLSAMVAKAKASANGLDDDEIKRETQRAAKFASYVRVVYGAVATGRMSRDECNSFVNNELLVTECRAALNGDGRPGDAPITYKGETKPDAGQAFEAKVQRKAKSLKDAVAEVGALQGFTPEQVADLQAKAEDKAAHAVFEDALTKAAKSGTEYGAKLATARGRSVAVAYLQAALDAAMQSDAPEAHGVA